MVNNVANAIEAAAILSSSIMVKEKRPSPSYGSFRIGHHHRRRRRPSMKMLCGDVVTGDGQTDMLKLKDRQRLCKDSAVAILNLFPQSAYTTYRTPFKILLLIP